MTPFNRRDRIETDRAAFQGQDRAAYPRPADGQQNSGPQRLVDFDIDGGGPSASSSLADDVMAWRRGQTTPAAQKLMADQGQHDQDLGLAFFQIRQMMRLTVPSLARAFGCTTDVIDALEAGAVHEFPPDAELARLISHYAAEAHIAPDVLLDRVQTYRPHVRRSLSRGTVVDFAEPQPLVPQYAVDAPYAIAPMPEPPVERLVPQYDVPIAPAIAVPVAEPLLRGMEDVTAPRQAVAANAEPRFSPQIPAFPSVMDVAPPNAFDPRGIAAVDVQPTARTGFQLPTLETNVSPRSARRAVAQAPKADAQPSSEQDPQSSQVTRFLKPFASFRERLNGRTLTLMAAAVITLGLYFAGLWPRLLYMPVALMPEAQRPLLRGVIDPVARLLAPRSEGLTWIEVGDPRLRKAERLRPGQR